MGKARLARSHGGQALPPAHRFREVLIVPLPHFGLIVQQVHLRRRPHHVQVDAALGLGREMGQMGQPANGHRPRRRWPGDLRPEGCRGRFRRFPLAPRRKKVTPGFRQDGFLVWMHLESLPFEDGVRRPRRFRGSGRFRGLSRPVRRALTCSAPRPGSSTGWSAWSRRPTRPTAAPRRAPTLRLPAASRPRERLNRNARQTAGRSGGPRPAPPISSGGPAAGW